MADVSPARFQALRDEIFASRFAPDADTRRIGAEVEVLAHDVTTNRPLLLLGDDGLIARLRRYGAPLGWVERRGYGPISTFDVPGQAIISFEPGGQIEVSTVPNESATAVVRCAQAIMQPLRAALIDDGVRLESVGIDWCNDARRIPMQLPVERYETMTRYFERIGPFGIRMMRQTAAIQVSLDRGPRPAERWRLLNDLAPYVVAIFANSPHYHRVETGHRSFRAHCWRMLDSTRTGVRAPRDDPAADYTNFALAANDIIRSADGEITPFAARYEADVEPTAWQNHLTTLFPEVRPRGHFEVRSCDAIDPEWYAAPIVLLCGLVYDERAAREASLLAADSRALLRSAGEAGLRDASIARTARDLFQLGLDGAARLGPPAVGPAELEVAGEYFNKYTARDRSPADDRVLDDAVETAEREPEPTSSG